MEVVELRVVIAGRGAEGHGAERPGPGKTGGVRVKRNGTAIVVRAKRRARQSAELHATVDQADPAHAFDLDAERSEQARGAHDLRRLDGFEARERPRSVGLLGRIPECRRTVARERRRDRDSYARQAPQFGTGSLLGPEDGGAEGNQHGDKTLHGRARARRGVDGST